MFYIIAGIAVLLLVWLLPVPYVLWVIGLIVGVVLILYGLWAIFGGPRGPVDGAPRRRRVWY